MAWRVFFSFHFQRDIWRVNQIRNSWRFVEEAGFWDNSLWEATRLRGDTAIKRLIDQGMVGASVTCVLIGTETANRKYVRYEIEQSHLLGKGLLGVYIHNVEDHRGETCAVGPNPFASIKDPRSGLWLSSLYPTYWWYGEEAHKNFGTWVEEAARKAGR